MSKWKRKLQRLVHKGLPKIIAYTISIIVVIIVLFPIIWMIPAAFKPRSELFALPNTFFPKKPTIDNFKLMFNASVNGTKFITSLGSTLLVSILATATSLTVNMFAAYGFARFNFIGKKWLWVYFLISMFTPGITIMLTSIAVCYDLRMIDTIWVLFVPGMANTAGIFFFRQFFYGMPRSLEESAFVDGASRFKIFLHIYLPNATTPIIINGLGVFMGTWNSFIWPTLTIQENARLTQVSQIINIMESRYSANYGMIIAATLVSVIIPLTLFALFQKKIIQGVQLHGFK